MLKHGILSTLYLGTLLMSGTVRAEDPASHGIPKAPKGYVLVDEDIWARLADEPGRHLLQARHWFVKADFAKSAEELRKAEIYLRGSASQARLESRIALSTCAHELEHLARRVETGKVKSVSDFDASYTRAQHALAKYYYTKATESWHDQQAHRAGLYLHAASNNLENTAANLSGAVKSGAHEVARDTRVIAGKLIDGTGFVVDEVSKGFQHFGASVDSTGRDIWPGVPRPNPPRARPSEASKNALIVSALNRLDVERLSRVEQVPGPLAF